MEQKDLERAVLNVTEEFFVIMSMVLQNRPARKGGVKRISGRIYDLIRVVLKVFLENVIKDTILYTENALRRTVTCLDVVHALKRQGRTLYGYGG